jgi:uncharacterized paraquat-inducible protein A
MKITRCWNCGVPIQLPETVDGDEYVICTRCHEPTYCDDFIEEEEEE